MCLLSGDSSISSGTSQLLLLLLVVSNSSTVALNTHLQSIIFTFLSHKTFSQATKSMVTMVTTTVQDLEANCVHVLACQFQFSPSPRTTLERTFLYDDDTLVSATAAANPNNNSEPFYLSSWNVVTPEKKKIPAEIVGRPQTLISTSSVLSLSSSSSSRATSSSWACLLPTADDPIDNSFLLCLDSTRDIGRINPVHILVRRHIFEVRRTANTGRVFFQCACCKHRPRADRAKLSTLAPQNVDSIYRAFVRFMMQHVSSCPDIPHDIRRLDARAGKIANNRNNGGGNQGCSRRSTGIKNYWASSAKRMGLMDGLDGKSIVYRHLLTTAADDVSGIQY